MHVKLKFSTITVQHTLYGILLWFTRTCNLIYRDYTESIQKLFVHFNYWLIRNWMHKNKPAKMTVTMVPNGELFLKVLPGQLINVWLKALILVSLFYTCKAMCM